MMLLQITNAAVSAFPADLINKLGDKYFLRLLIDFVAVCVLLFGIYYPNNNKNREYLFTMFIFNVVIFHIGFLLKSVELSLGAAFGLFAVFGLLRYRTEDIPMKDMTYLFISIAVGLIVAVTQGDWEPAVVCCVILLPTFLLDSSWIFRKQLHKDVRYERVDMVKPENHDKLKEELRQRTGLDIHFIRVQDIDFVRDTATVRIFYYERD